MTAPARVMTVAEARAVLAVDPGTHESGWVLLSVDRDGVRLSLCGVSPNDDVLSRGLSSRDVLVVERPQFAGKATRFTDELCETIIWIGKFARDAEIGGAAVATPFRRTVVAHHCGVAKANDADVRHALIERFGGKEVAVGRKTTPGPLYAVKSHAWQALACGLYWIDTHEKELRDSLGAEAAALEVR